MVNKKVQNHIIRSNSLVDMCVAGAGTIGSPLAVVFAELSTHCRRRLSSRQFKFRGRIKVIFC